MESLESAVRPALEPLLLGAAPGTSIVLDPDRQAVLATWAVKTGLLLVLSKFRGTDHGWVPADTLQWLKRHHKLLLPPLGCRVWMSGLMTTDISASVQSGCLYDSGRNPAAQILTFSRLRAVPRLRPAAAGR